MSCVQAAAKSIDFIIDTVSAQHPLEPYLKVLKTNGKMCLVGIPEKPLQVWPFMLTSGKLNSSPLVQTKDPSAPGILIVIKIQGTNLASNVGVGTIPSVLNSFAVCNTISSLARNKVFS